MIADNSFGQHSRLRGMVDASLCRTAIGNQRSVEDWHREIFASLIGLGVGGHGLELTPLCGYYHVMPLLAVPEIGIAFPHPCLPDPAKRPWEDVRDLLHREPLEKRALRDMRVI
jgi:hypothetical protein